MLFYIIILLCKISLLCCRVPDMSPVWPWHYLCQSTSRDSQQSCTCATEWYRTRCRGFADTTL